MRETKRMHQGSKASAALLIDKLRKDGNVKQITRHPAGADTRPSPAIDTG